MAGISQPKLITISLVSLWMIFMLFSCKNDMETIRMLDVADTLPTMSADDIEIIYSEKGKVQVRLVSPKLVKLEGDDEFMEFPDGFKVFFYDSNLHVRSTISANYGISYEKKDLMVARHNVVVENLDKNERLNTEELFWDRSKKRIYSDKFVRITRNDEIITGDGLESDEGFEDIEIKNPKGVIEIREDEAPEKKIGE